MAQTLQEDLAGLQRLAQLHLEKAFLCLDSVGDKRQKLLDAIMDVSAWQRNYAAALFSVRGLSVDTHIPEFLEHLDTLDAVCRELKIPGNGYDYYRARLLNEAGNFVGPVPAGGYCIA